MVKKKQYIKASKTYTIFLSLSLVMVGLQSPLAVAKQTDTKKTDTKKTILKSNDKKAVKNLISLLKPIKSIHADFTQTTKAKNPQKTKKLKQRSGMSGLKVSNLNKKFSGTMVVQRPNKFYWHTKAPSEQKIIANGKSVWIYDPDLEQATLQKVDKQFSNTPALLLSGNADAITKSYNVVQPKPNEKTFVLYPKSEDSVFEELAIAFVNGKPRAMVLNDSLGQMTVIKFTKLKINQPIPKKTFVFNVPKGVDIIKQ